MMSPRDAVARGLFIWSIPTATTAVKRIKRKRTMRHKGVVCDVSQLCLSIGAVVRDIRIPTNTAHIVRVTRTFSAKHKKR
jgi:hypothetical protein